MIRRGCTDGGFDGDPADGTYTVSIDPSENESPSTAVVRAVAAITNTSPLDLDPLYHTIDPDELDELFRRSGDANARAEVTFTYNGCEVRVTESEIRIRRTRDT